MLSLHTRHPAVCALFVLSAVALAGTDDYPTSLAGCHPSNNPGKVITADLKNSTQDTLIDPWSEFNRECVSFVAWRLHARNGYEMPFHAYASDWKAKAQNARITVDNTPGVGAVAWFSYGHVAWVEAVSGNQVTIEEYNYSPSNPNKRPYSYGERTISATSVSNYIHFRDINPGNVAGYTWCNREGQTNLFNTPVDVAYGADTRFRFRYAQSGNITFDNLTFGDPAGGVVKAGYFRPFSFCTMENGTYTFSGPVEIAYGANARFYYREGVSGTVTFSNATFGDPLPGVVKAGYCMPYTKCADENQLYWFMVPTDIAYGANGHFVFRTKVTGPVTFNNATFGDPAWGIVKAGFFRPSH